MNSQPNTKDLIVQEKHMASHLGLLEEFIKNKYGLVDDEVSLQNIRKIQEEKKIEAIRSKTMHSILFTDDDNVFDQKFSTLWLTKGNISGKQEGMMAKLQDRNLYFGANNKKCPHCKTATKSVEHLATHCGRLLSFDYKQRHDEVVRCLHYHFTKKYGLTKTTD